MVVATKSVDAILKGIVSPDKLMLARMDSIIKSIQLDPAISSPKKELFVISNEDIKSAKVRKDFLEALNTKHSDCVIMFINKRGVDIPGITPDLFNSYINKPKHEDVRDAFVSLVEEAEAKAKFSVDDDLGEIDKMPEGVVSVPTTEEPEEVEEEVKEEEPIRIEEVEVPEEQPQVEPEHDLTLIERIRQAENWAALGAVSKEINASRVVQEIASTNATFKQSEAYVAALQESITAIMMDPDIDVKSKLDKVHAIMCDKSFISAKTSSIIEQNVEMIVRLLTEKASEEISEIASSMNEKVNMMLSRRTVVQSPNARLANIADQKAKLLIELSTIDFEIRRMLDTVVKTVNDTTDNVVESAMPTSGSALVDQQIQMKFGNLVPDTIIETLDKLFVTGKDASEEFGKLSDLVHSCIRKLYAALDLHAEEADILGNTIRYMKANKVEDTVIANSILKKATRMYITSGDFDSTAIVHLISSEAARKITNVLIVDLTKSDTFNLYGIKTNKLSNMLDSVECICDDKFSIISNFDDDSVGLNTDNLQRLSSKLLMYAKNYSRIHLIVSDDMKEVIEFFKSDVISMNFIVNCFPRDIARFKETIASSRVDNTAMRVILINYVSDSAKICEDLGIMEWLDVQLATIPIIPELHHCALNKQDPFFVSSVQGVVGGIIDKC